MYHTLCVSKRSSSTNIQSAILAPLSRKFAGRAEIIKTGLHGCAYPLPSHKLVKASADTLKHIPTALSQLTHTHMDTHGHTRTDTHAHTNNPTHFLMQQHDCVAKKKKCCNEMMRSVFALTYFGDQPRHLTRYSILPCDGWKGGKKKTILQRGLCQTYYFNVRGAFCTHAPFSLCYLADALLFDALHRKDVLSGGRELHSRPGSRSQRTESRLKKRYT